MNMYSHHRIHFACLTVTCCLAWITATATSAKAAANIVSIEEHWELSVGRPTPARSSPQTSMVMSPRMDLSGTYFIFTLNHKSNPEFSAGGMQVQEWDADKAQGSHNGPQAGTLVETDEVIHWTQRMEIQNGLLTFEILNGTSKTWSSFGGQGYLKSSISTLLSNLNGYRVANSLGESEVGYAGNRVHSLILKKLIWITDDGVVHELVSPIAIDTDLNP